MAVRVLARRRFIAVGSAAAIAPVVIPGSALGLDGTAAPSERIVVGGIGLGRRGEYDLGCFLEQADVRFAAVCDVKEDRRAQMKKKVDARYGDERCTMHRDFRELLDLRDIDAVLIATARGVCFRPAPSGGICRTSPLPASLPARGGSASSRGSTLIPPA